MHQITVITVCYHSTDILPGLIASVPEDVPVVLVNNSQDDAERIAAFDGGRVQVIHAGENLGFGAGCNLGAEVATTPYLLFLNPDAMLMESAIDALLRAAAEHPEASAFNPYLSDETGKLRNKRSSILLPMGRIEAAVFAKGGDVPVLTGAALMVRRDAFDAVGGFDERIFLYHEDDDIALRLADHGPLRIVADAKVLHRGGHGSGDRVGSAGLKAYHMGRSRLYSLRKHGRPYARGRSIALAVGQLLSPTTWLSRRKRVKQMEFLRGILSVKGTN